MRDDDRAVSTTLSYVLTLAIASLLVTGLLMAGSDFIADRQEQVIRTELRVIGQQVASDVQRADRMVQADHAVDPSTVELDQRLPERITGTGYQIALESSPDQLVLTAFDPEVEETVSFDATTAIDESTVNGGTIRVRYTGSDELVVENV